LRTRLKNKSINLPGLVLIWALAIKSQVCHSSTNLKNRLIQVVTPLFKNKKLQSGVISSRVH
jgi:hypothetical protein